MIKEELIKKFRSLFIILVLILGLSMITIPTYALENEDIVEEPIVVDNQPKVYENITSHELEEPIINNVDLTQNNQNVVGTDSNQNKRDLIDVDLNHNSLTDLGDNLNDNEESIDNNTLEDDSSELESDIDNKDDEDPIDDVDGDLLNLLKGSPTKNGDTTPISEFITSVTIIGVEPDSEDGRYLITPGAIYSVKMDFAEDYENRQFPNSGTMTYELPVGFEAVDIADGTFDITISEGVGTQPITIHDNHYSIQDGEISINWSTTDPNIQRLFAISNTSFYLEFHGLFDFDGTETNIRFNDSVVLPVKKDEQENSINMYKSSKVPDINPNATNTTYSIEYTIEIDSTGTNMNFDVFDELIGNGIKLDPNSFVVVSDPANIPVSYTKEVDEFNNKFSFHFDRLVDGQKVFIYYSAIIDEKSARIEGEGENKKFYIDATNKARIENEGEIIIPPHYPDDEIEIKPYIQKVGKLEGTDKIVWNISVNANNKLLISGMPVIDTIDPSSAEFLEYYGRGIKVTIYDDHGNQVGNEPIIVSWEDILNPSGTGWKYIIPSNDHYYRYEIEYETSFTAPKKDTIVKNGVDFGDNHSSSEIGIPGYDEIQIKKEATNVDLDAMQITWEITIEVPKDGLDETNYILRDVYPVRRINDDLTVYEIIRNKYTDIEVEGLEGTETYQVTLNSQDATITFYKDGALTPGLNGTNSNRTIKVTLKTEINEDWLNKTLEQNSSEFITHYNNIYMGNKHTVAQVDVALRSLNKDGLTAQYATIDGVKYPVYQYNVKIGYVDEDEFTLEDIFDTNLFRIYTEHPDNNDLFLLGGDSYNNQTNVGGGWQNARKIEFDETPTGVTFKITPELVAKKNDGSLYKYYSFIYYLISKDNEALHDLMQLAAEHNGEYDVVNKIKYKDMMEADSIQKFKYDVFKKKQVGEFNETDGTVTFEIEINPDEILLNNNDTYTLVDTYNNLSIIYDSIEITPSEGIIYDAQGNSLTFTIPDAKRVVINYTARVLYAPEQTGEHAGETPYKNLAALITGNSTFYSEVSDYAEIDSSGGGSGSLINIKLLKYEAGNMSNKLAGAVFRLLDASGKPMLKNNGEEITFTTGSDGIITVVGNQQAEGWNLRPNTLYQLEEIKAPDGYMLPNFFYKFTITETNVPNYREYIFLNGDTMTAKNYPGTDIFVTKEWEDGNENHESDNVTVQLQERIEGEEEWKPSSEVELSKENDWKAEFRELPLVVTIDEEDLSIEYRVIETKVNGTPIEEGEYELIDNGDNTYTIQNSVTNEKTEATVKKVWDDDDNQDGKRPESLTVTLKVGEKVIDTVTLNEDNEWTATIDGLDKYADGVEIEYTWSEGELPEGYELTGNSKEGTVTTLTNSYKPELTEISFTKVDIDTGEKLEGAKLQVLDSEGKIVDEWISTKETHVVKGLATNKEYTLKEVVAPDGYIIASNIKFVIDSMGKVTTNGKTATDDEGNIIILVENEKTKIVVTKVDITTGEELPGAKIQIIDSEGIVVEEWISTKEGHVIEGLKVNEEYTLREIVAPDGYEITADITFIINEDGTVTTTGKIIKDAEGKAVLLVQDTKSPNKVPEEKPPKNPGTADYFDLYMMLLKIFILGFFSSTLYIYKQNKA